MQQPMQRPTQQQGFLTDTRHTAQHVDALCGTPRTDMPRTPQHIHPAVWRACELAQIPGSRVDTGFPQLSAQLPGGGWPLGNLVELLVQPPGTGELRLLCPALSSLASRAVLLVHPPYTPHIAAWANAQCPPGCLLWARPQSRADALWATEQALRSNTFGAVLLWQKVMSGPGLRRLQVAAQEGGTTLCALVRPLAAAIQPSSAPLRLILRPSPRGLVISILKRRGATHNGLIQIDTAFSRPGHHHEDMDRRTPATSPSQKRQPSVACQTGY